MIRTLEDLSPLEKLSLVDISYSRLSTAEMCNAKYFYTYILKEERVFGEAATLGNIVHSVMEETDWERPLNLPELHQLYREFRPQWDPDSQISEKLIDVGYQMLSEFYDRHKEEKFEVLAVELPFNMIIGSAYISGYIDQLHRGSNGVITVLDWKTGRNEVAQKNIAMDLQLGTYALAVSQLYPAENTIQADLYYLRSGRRKGHTFSREDLEDVERRLLEKINDLISTNTFQYTNNRRVCSFCDFNSICPVGKKMSSR